jgi:hypothetical protein
VNAFERDGVRLVLDERPRLSPGREGSIALTLRATGGHPVTILLDDVTTLQLSQLLRATLADD